MLTSKKAEEQARRDAELQAQLEAEKIAFEPKSYWSDTEREPVEIAAVLWGHRGSRRSYRLMARKDGMQITYFWAVSGEGVKVPANPKPTRKPMNALEVGALIDKVCFPGSSLEKAWEIGWKAEQQKDDFDDSTENLLLEHLDLVTDAYTIQTKFYPTLPKQFGQASLEWLDEKMEAWRQKRRQKAVDDGDTDAMFDDELLMEYEFSADDWTH